MTEVLAETEAGQAYEMYSADLSAFANQTVYIAIRHHNCHSENLLRVDSFAVRFAESGELTPMYGDADLDRAVTVMDALLIIRHVVGAANIDPEILDPWCDVNGDGNINTMDALMILRYALGMIAAFPVGQ